MQKQLPVTIEIWHALNMAEIQQSAVADSRSSVATMRALHSQLLTDGVNLADAVAVQKLAAMRLAPLEETGLENQAVFDDFMPGLHLAFRE